MREFRHGSHLLQQDLFKAETPDHHVSVVYDDVEFGILLTVVFKNRWVQSADCPELPWARRVEMQFGDANKAIARALRFLRQHPVPQPYCDVDY